MPKDTLIDSPIPVESTPSAPVEAAPAVSGGSSLPPGTPGLFSVRIIAEGQQWDPDGDGFPEPCPVGTIITSQNAWELCKTFFRNTHIAEPADQLTADRIAAHRLQTQPAKDAAKAQLQSQVNAMAKNAALKLEWLPDGTPKRDASGEILGKLSNAQRFRLENAVAYGIKPQQ
jgi:hypothetical protein